MANRCVNLKFHRELFYGICAAISDDLNGIRNVIVRNMAIVFWVMRYLTELASNPIGHRSVGTMLLILAPLEDHLQN